MFRIVCFSAIKIFFNLVGLKKASGIKTAWSSSTMTQTEKSGGPSVGRNNQGSSEDQTVKVESNVDGWNHGWEKNSKYDGEHLILKSYWEICLQR